MNQGKMVMICLAFVCVFAGGISAQMVDLRSHAGDSSGTQLISLTAPEPVSGSRLGDTIMPILPPNDESPNLIPGGAPITAVPEPATISFVLLGLGMSGALLRFRRTWRV
jgi:hypothetical protein